MINTAQIKTGFSGLIGYKQPFNPEYAVISDSNLVSESGLTVNSNPYAKIKYLRECQDYEHISDEQFNEVLQNVILDSAVNVCNSVFNEPSQLDSSLLFRNATNFSKLSDVPNGFVGLELDLYNCDDIMFQIPTVYLNFQGNTDLELIVYSTLTQDIIRRQTFTISGSSTKVDLNWTFTASETSVNDKYYFGYIKTDTTPQPYERDYDIASLKTRISHMYCEECYVSGHIGDTLFDLDALSYTSRGIGINPIITTSKDYTEIAIRNKHLFARAVYLEAVIAFLREYLVTDALNFSQRQGVELYNKILLEIEGSQTKDNVIAVKGLRPQLIGEIADIKKHLESLKEDTFGNGFFTYTEA